MGQTIGELFVKLDADTSQFESSMQRSLSQTQGFVKGHEAAFKKVGMAVTAAGAAITAAIGLSIKSYADAGDAAKEMSERTGLSVENIMQLDHAAKLSGTSIDSLEVGMKKAAKVITDAGDGSTSAMEALNKLGLSVDKLIGKKPDEQFNLLATALSNIKDPTERAAAAQEIFGRSGTQLLPMLADGAAGLAKMKQEAVDLGLVMSADAAAKADQFNDSLTILKGSLQGVKNTIGAALIPVLLPLIQKITEIMKNIKDWTVANPGLTKALSVVALAVGVLGVVFGPLIMALPFIVSGITTLITLCPVLGVAFTVMTGPIGIVIAAIGLLIAAGILIVKNWDKIKEGAQIVWDAIVGFVKAGVNLYIGYLNMLIKGVLTGINLIIKGLNLIPKVNIPEIPIMQIPTLHTGGEFRAPTPGGEGLAMLKDRERVIPAGVTESAAGMGTGVQTIQVNNPLSPEDLQKVIRAVNRNNLIKGYISNGLQGT